MQILEWDNVERLFESVYTRYVKEDSALPLIKIYKLSSF